VTTPRARAGRRGWGVDEAEAEWYLGVVEQRVVSGQNGAAWQSATYHQLIDEQGYERPEAAREMVRRYQKLSEAGQPVHTWPVGG
jgi:hypothetical protein